jgi:DNA-binding NtrC family response regulator
MNVSMRAVTQWFVRQSQAWLPLRAITSLDEAEKLFERRYLARLLATTRGDLVAAVRISHLNWQELHDLFARHRLNPADYKTLARSGWFA